MLKQIFFYSTYNSLSPQNTFFQNCQIFSNWEPSDMYISLSFLYKSGTLEAYIYLHSNICFLHIFCLGMFSIDSGSSAMAWLMNPLHQGKEFHWNALKLFFNTCNSLSIPKYFFTIFQFFSNWEPYEISISLSCLYTCETIEAYISVHIDLFYIFLSGNTWNRSWVKCYGMEYEPPISD